MANGDPGTLTWRLARLEDEARDREQRLRAIELVIARLPGLEDDVKDTAENCKAIRGWVEHREDQKEKLTAGQRVAIITGLFGLAVAFLALLGTMINAGVFG